MKLLVQPLTFLNGIVSSENSWKKSQHKFLFPVRALSRVFRGKFMEMLKKSDLVLPKNTSVNQLKSIYKISHQKENSIQFF